MGFVLRASWKCGMCGTAVCKDCHVVLPSHPHPHPHTCKHEDVLTANELAKQTKPCPHCAVPTFRISGCSQMWCVMCHQPWNWNTGLPEGGIIHNPHYFDWRRQQVEEQRVEAAPVAANVVVVAGAGDNVVFDEVVYFWEVEGERRDAAPYRPWRTNPEAVPPLHTQLLLVTEPSHRRMLETLNQRLTHLWVVERPKLLRRELTDNMDLRIKYMRKEVTEAQFKRQLQQREKKHEKFTEYAGVITAHCVQARNQLREMMRGTSSPFACIVELHKLWEANHTRIEAVADKYDAVPPKFFQME